MTRLLPVGSRRHHELTDYEPGDMTMRNTARGIISAGALILLAACGGTEANDGGTLALPSTAQASDTTQPDPTTDSDATATEEAEETEEFTGAPTNDRGNIEKKIGEEAGVLDSETGDQLLTFAVDSITPDVACDTSEYSEPEVPQNGHFTKVDLRVSTAPALGVDSYTTISASDFKFIGPDGLTVSDLGTFGAFSCLDEGGFASEALGPGQKYAGSIVLDLPATTGTLIFAPYFGQTGGWEYAF